MWEADEFFFFRAAQAEAKYDKDFAGSEPFSPEVTVPDPSSVRVTALYKPGADGARSGAAAAAAPEMDTPSEGVAERAAPAAPRHDSGEALEEGVTFAWEEVDPRPAAGAWRWS